MKIYTIGHGNGTVDPLIEMLKAQGIGCLVDVRSRPGSGRFPQFNKTALEQALNRAGLRYVWEGEALGGQRPALSDDLRHGALEAGFRSFASHMETPEFRAGIERLLDYARTHRTAILCAEKDPSHCHRALIADYLTVRGYDLRHIVAPGENRRHILHPAAWLEGQGLIYAPPGTPDSFVAKPDPFAAGTTRASGGP